MNHFIYGRRILDERNRYRRWIDPRVVSLPVSAVLAYLRVHGWEEVPPDRTSSRIFREPGSPGDPEPFYQFLPESELSPNYRQLMFELVTGLAEFEDRQASAVIDDILALVGKPDANGPSPRQAVNVEAIS